MQREEILRRIEETLPSARRFIRGVFNYRLEALCSKNNPAGREVRWYRKEDKFCLPHTTRQAVVKENIEDEFLRIKVTDIFKERAAALVSDHDNRPEPETAATLAHRAIELTFEKEGLELAAFLTGENDNELYVSIADQVDEAVIDLGVKNEDAEAAKEVALQILRHAFYNSSEPEREYFGKLSRTYTLLFTLRNEPRIVEYFKSMSSNFVLFIGSDLLIRALSERYLPQEDQMTVNMLRILKEAGSTLVLSESSLEEIHAHIEGTDWEFQNFFMTVEPSVDKNIARHASKILIRAYFYARVDPLVGVNAPRGWRSFVGQFCDYANLHSARGREEIKMYLIEKFGMEFASHEDMTNLADAEEVRTLAERIRPVKKEDVLALNDALQILAVYGKRRELGEEHKANPFGYRTWWLTHESRVRRFTGELVQRKRAQYIMRPEFVLNFISLSPSTEEVRQSYGAIFPTLLGVRLSNRMREDIFHDVMSKVKQAWEVDEARARVMMNDMSNRLKGDHFKRYEASLTEGVLDD